MKALLLQDGKNFIAEKLAGSSESINGMYVEFSSEECTSVENRCAAYFDDLLRSESSGYGRIAISGITCKDGVVEVSGIVTSTDLKGGKLGKNSKLVAVTLVCMKDEKVVNDRLLYSALLTSPIKVVKGVHNFVSVSFAIG